jgi:hypothetical protein
MHKQRDFLLLGIVVAVAVTPTFGPNQARATDLASLTPDFSGLWGHPSWPGFEPPASGPGPVVNKSRLTEGPQKGVSHPSQFVGDYTNPMLRPEAAEVVKKHGEVELSGVAAPTPSNQCWPEPLPYIFWNVAMEMLQQPDHDPIRRGP